MTRFFALNEGPLDRGLRVALGLTLLALTVTGPHTLWGLIGAVPLLTGLTGRCPIYAALDIDTRPKRTA
jgi:hypothetical protein